MKDEADPAILEAIDEAANRFISLGAKVKMVSLPHTRHALPTYYILASAEASSNLARYDGFRYGNLQILSC
jgi:aspartyl-tRNA(Asn)/glutamyl-tRNA(Gln) amidotransferase subunit A